jgi:hypothetical protein
MVPGSNATRHWEISGLRFATLRRNKRPPRVCAPRAPSFPRPAPFATRPTKNPDEYLDTEISTESNSAGRGTRAPNRLMTEEFRRVASRARRDDESYC